MLTKALLISVRSQGATFTMGRLKNYKVSIFSPKRRRANLLSGTFDRETDSANFDGDNFPDFEIRTDEFNSVVEGSGTIDVVVSLGEDADGHLYLVDYSVGLFANMLDSGEIYRLIPDLPADFNDDGFVNVADLNKVAVRFRSGRGL